MSIRDDIIAAARARLGIPYGLPPGPGQTDCSLYVRDVYEAVGLPFSPGVRTAEQERQDTVVIPWDQVLPGDLLYFADTYDAGPPSADGHIASHIGISLGAGTHRMLNAVEPVSKESDISTAYWQSHIFEARRHRALVADAPAATASDPWRYFTADAITRATSANLDHVRLYWPKIVAQMDLAGINTRAAQIAALATIAVEVGARFEPIHEYGTPANWAGYSGGAQYAGRGFIQLTHDYNYRTYGKLVDDLWQASGAIDLVARPDDALDPDVASAVLALYFREHGIPAMAEAGDWQGVRRAVNGGLTGWQTFKSAVDALSAAPVPDPPNRLPPVPAPQPSQRDRLIAIRDELSALIDATAA